MPKPNLSSHPTDDEQAARDEERDLDIALSTRTDLEPLVESAALNRRLLKMARMSHNEISQKTGIPAGEVAERLATLLDNRGWRDDLMEEKLLLSELGDLISDVRERMSRNFVEDEAWASMARVQLAIIKTVLEQLTERRKNVDGKLALVTQLQAELMGAAIRLAQERAVLNIQRKYPELDPEIIYAAFDEELPKAIALLNERADD